MIVEILRHYFPKWQPPEDTGREWVQCLCPSHEETRPSAAVSFQNDAVSCLACGFKGNAVSIVMRKEGIGYQAAIRRAAEIAYRGNEEVPRKVRRKRSRAVFGEQRAARGSGHSIPVWLR